MESEENQKQVFHLFPLPLEIARRDSHISTAATAVVSLLLSKQQKNKTTKEPGLKADLQAHPSMRICYRYFARAQ